MDPPEGPLQLLAPFLSKTIFQLGANSRACLIVVHPNYSHLSPLFGRDEDGLVTVVMECEGRAGPSRLQ